MSAVQSRYNSPVQGRPHGKVKGLQTPSSRGCARILHERYTLRGWRQHGGGVWGLSALIYSGSSTPCTTSMGLATVSSLHLAQNIPSHVVAAAEAEMRRKLPTGRANQSGLLSHQRDNTVRDLTNSPPILSFLRWNISRFMITRWYSILEVSPRGRRAVAMQGSVGDTIMRQPPRWMKGRKVS